MANNLPARFFGLTVDDVSDAEKIYKRLKLFKDHVSSAPRPIVRFVFDIDRDTSPQDYRDVIREIQNRELGYVMGEIMDSQYIHACRSEPLSTACYLDRTKSYFQTLGEWVDIWEIGNEVNGEWTGWYNGEWEKDYVSARDMQETSDWVAAQVAAAYNYLKIEKRKPVAVTFYFNEDGEGEHSWTDIEKKETDSSPNMVRFGQHHGMLEWAAKYRHMFPVLDYVFVSYYQDNEWIGSNERRRQFIPSIEQWARIFTKLRGFYPDAKLGFGEVGPECRYLGDSCEPQEPKDGFEGDCKDRDCECCLKAQPIYLERYYLDWDAKIRARLGSDYVGGYFYWHFSPDVVRRRNPNTIKMLKKIYADWYR